MSLSHSSTVHWDPPQHHWDSRLSICTWQEPHLQDGAHIIQPQPSHQQLFTQHHTQDLQDLQPGGTNLKVCCFLQLGSGELRVMLWGRKVRNHKQLPLTHPKAVAVPSPSGTTVSLPWSVSINSGHQRIMCPKVFSSCITWLLKDTASPFQPLAQADLSITGETAHC